ncbi:MAG: hypothetical protein R3B91_13380 [Planctomycetaceae bacterium]
MPMDRQSYPKIILSGTDPDLPDPCPTGTASTDYQADLPEEGGKPAPFLLGYTDRRKKAGRRDEAAPAPENVDRQKERRRFLRRLG